MFTSLPPFITNATLPQWLSALFTGGGVFWFAIKWRSQSLNSDEQIRRLMSEELAAARSTYALEVSRLTTQLMEKNDQLDAKNQQFIEIEKHWREMLIRSDERHDECEAARLQLRSELDRMHAELRALHSRVRAASTDRVLVMEESGSKPSEVAPHSAAAARRMRNRRRGNKEDQKK